MKNHVFICLCFTLLLSSFASKGQLFIITNGFYGSAPKPNDCPSGNGCCATDVILYEKELKGLDFTNKNIYQVQKRGRKIRFVFFKTIKEPQNQGFFGVGIGDVTLPQGLSKELGLKSIKLKKGNYKVRKNKNSVFVDVPIFIEK
ncbi:hypothetical protein Emtol_0064 (plasmid) [Emticicia oligotrophica DSM 17448]|uniref:Uncharacterized protein n=1 Tax=Emticicia oligotrophica (strain DSM 17448 / CIP 109782 / MTCC 6937 / GPTSA100-15) TaxID=929562 RepID=A0ABM5N8I0_EMTOG|nr:hypothetical protein [Emticicia oligotrophica]AFK05694.1 hypothetical protein Emtol_0064 [Emticicia oligotrophica DSM 17448]